MTEILAYNNLKEAYKKFDEQARRVVNEAKRYDTEYVGTEFLLLGLIKEIDGTGTRALRNFEVDMNKLEEKILRLIGKPLTNFPGVSPLTPRAKEVILLSKEYSEKLNQERIGHGHLMYGCLKSGSSVSRELLLEVINEADFERELTSLLTIGRTSRRSKILDSRGIPYSLGE